MSSYSMYDRPSVLGSIDTLNEYITLSRNVGVTQSSIPEEGNRQYEAVSADEAPDQLVRV
jgi:hypothetical protein